MLNGLGILDLYTVILSILEYSTHTHTVDLLIFGSRLNWALLGILMSDNGIVWKLRFFG